MASSACAAASAAARYVPTAGSAKSSRFAGNKAPLTARASRVAARRAAVGAQAVVSPPQTHDNARPDTALRPVSAAAVDSNKALEQFRSMGGASRKFSLSHLTFLPYLFFFSYFFSPSLTTPRRYSHRASDSARDAIRAGLNRLALCSGRQGTARRLLDG